MIITWLTRFGFCLQMTICDNLLSSMKVVLNGMGTLRISLENPANKVSLRDIHVAYRRSVAVVFVD